MASRHNAKFFKNLDDFGKVDTQKIFNIVQKETNETAAYIRDVIPYLYGGLQTGVYWETRATEHGVSAVIGIDNDPHLNMRGMHTHTKEVYVGKKRERDTGSPDDWQTIEVKNNSPLVRRDDITNAQLANILLHKQSSTGSQEQMEEIVQILEEFRENTKYAVNEYMKSKSKRKYK